MRTASLAIALFALAMLRPYGIANGAAAAPGTDAFSPNVSVAISDDAPGSHPDITTTVEAEAGAFLSQVRVLTPGGGGIANDGDINDNVLVGWISGFTTIPGSDDSCSQRYTFEVPLVKETNDTRTFPAFLQALAPGPHRIRFAADVADTPVNIIVDDVLIEGEPRLQTTTYIGDPAHLAPNCAPYRSRVIHDGTAGTFPPITTAPPTPGPRVYDFTLTSRDGQTAERIVTAAVQPGLRPALDGDALRWNAVPGAETYKTDGNVTFTTNCALIRRLVIRQADRPVGAKVAAGVTRAPLPPLPGPDYELAQTSIRVSAFDADGVLLARTTLSYTRDFKSCWYAPGTEPLLSAEPPSGPCDGAVTFRGSRFPPQVKVEITMPPYGSDGPGARVAVAPVAPDGTFAVTAALPERSCYTASFYPDGRMVFFAYNADEPKGMTILAGAPYAAAVSAGARVTAGPNAGAGPGRRSRSYPWWLIAMGAASLAAGVAVSRRKRSR